MMKFKTKTGFGNQDQGIQNQDRAQHHFLPARRYARVGLCDSDVSVCHTPVLCLAERKQDREMYTI